jgi:hypothetical protein
MSCSFSCSEIYGILAFGLSALSFAWTSASMDTSAVSIPEFREAFEQKMDEFWRHFVSRLIGVVIGVTGGLLATRIRNREG